MKTIRNLALLIVLIYILPVAVNGQEEINGLAITAENAYGADEAIIASNFEATTDFDYAYDQVKEPVMTPGVATVYTSTSTGTDNYAVNQFPQQELDIPVYIVADETGTHTVTFAWTEGFENTQCIKIKDMVTGEVYDLLEPLTLTLTLEAGDAAPRFSVKFGAPVYTQGHNATCFGDDNGSIDFGKNSDSLFSIKCFDAFGYLVSESENVYEISELEELVAGTYFVETTDHLCGTRVDVITIEQPQEIQPGFTPSSSAIILPYDNAEISFDNQSTNAEYFHWEFADLGESDNESPSFEFGEPGVYTTQLTAYQSNECYKTIELDIHVTTTSSFAEYNPNPMNITLNQSLLTIETNWADGVEVRTLSGQLVSSYGSFSNSTTLELLDMPQQVLIVSIRQGDEVSTSKVSYMPY